MQDAYILWTAETADNVVRVGHREVCRTRREDRGQSFAATIHPRGEAAPRNEGAKVLSSLVSLVILRLPYRIQAQLLTTQGVCFCYSQVQARGLCSPLLGRTVDRTA